MRAKLCITEEDSCGKPSLPTIHRVYIHNADTSWDGNLNPERCMALWDGPSAPGHDSRFPYWIGGVQALMYITCLGFLKTVVANYQAGKHNQLYAGGSKFGTLARVKLSILAYQITTGIALYYT